MWLLRIFFLLSLILVTPGIFAQSPDSVYLDSTNGFKKYYNPLDKELTIQYKGKKMLYDGKGVFHFVRYLPDDMWQIAKSPFQQTNLKGLGAVVLSTALLLPFDQSLTNGVRNLSENIHLSNQTSYGIAFGVGPAKIIKYPRNINSAFYQLGEGGTSMFLAGGLWIYGKITKDYRAVQTAGDLTETFIIMGVTTQILKRISGRESPYVATQKGGAWNPFPSFKAYQQHTPHYDAFPSGHLATMMATVTVLAHNYPEKKWIKPIGYSLMGLTACAMMNNEVHWMSDYPLALALGYLSGEISSMRHTKKARIKEIGL